MTRLPETQDVPDEVYAQAAVVFAEDQYRAVAWTITMINAFNRLSLAGASDKLAQIDRHTSRQPVNLGIPAIPYPQA